MQVKGPRDRLSEDQRAWMHALMDVDVQCEVLRVQVPAPTAATAAGSAAVPRTPKAAADVSHLAGGSQPRPRPAARAPMPPPAVRRASQRSQPPSEVFDLTNDEAEEPKEVAGVQEQSLSDFHEVGPGPGPGSEHATKAKAKQAKRAAVSAPPAARGSAKGRLPRAASDASGAGPSVLQQSSLFSFFNSTPR